MEKMITAKEVGELLGISPESIKTRFRRFGMPYYKVGGLIKFRASEIEDWLQSRRVDQKKSPVRVVKKIL